MKSQVTTIAYLLLSSVAFATPPQARPEPRESPCQEKSPYRKIGQQGTLLWGTGRTAETDETSTELASVEFQEGMLLQQGRLVVPSSDEEGVVGVVLRGSAMDEHPVKVAICDAEPAAQDPAMVWYRIELWNEERATWENPCVATNHVPSPRALAVDGVWDRSGARHEVEGRFTFACENGAIAKCIHWGYKPWEAKEGHSLKELHQACTRMARADYCGDGRSHTREETLIDMYDGLEVHTRAREVSGAWDPARASFEAAWTGEGAWCVARTRDGQPLEAVLAQCSDRFEVGLRNVGDGDKCLMRRKGVVGGPVLLHNRAYRPDALISQ